MISVIIPLYNGFSTIEKCVQSVIDQLYTDWELLIIDDGSNDGSSDLCDLIANTDSRIRVYHKENGGVSSSRNLGIKEAKGEWIIFLDADDYLMPNTLDTCLKNCYNSQLVVFGYKKLSNDVSVLPLDKKKYYMDSNDLQMDFKRLFENGFFHPVWNKLFKRESVSQYFDENIKLGEDLIFNINFLKSVNGITVIPFTLYLYNDININSATHKFRKDMITNQKAIKENLIALFPRFRNSDYLNRNMFMNIFNNLQLLVADSSYSKSYKLKFIKRNIGILRESLHTLKHRKKEMDYFEKIALLAIKHDSVTVLYYSFVCKNKAKNIYQLLFK